MGPSGAGKSSVLRAIAGLLTPERGRVDVGGRAWLDTDRGVDLPPERVPDLPSFLITDHPDGHSRVQRFAAYAVVHDPNDQVLLTRIADGYPGAGRWHLPGGGTDFGERPDEALLRELVEETGHVGRIERLLGVASHHEPVKLGPEGFPIDWHGVRVVYRVRVDAPAPPAATSSRTSGSPST